MSAHAKSSVRPMPASQLDILAEEFGAVAGRVEREASLRIDAAIADLRRIDAERELRLSNLERMVVDRIASVKDGKDGAPGRDGIDGGSVKLDDLVPIISVEVSKAVSAIPIPKDGEPGAPGRDGIDGHPGERGIDGAAGRDGTDGTNGIDGKDGAPGERGADGAHGRDGIDGKEGDAGRDGIDGKDGSSVTVDDIAPLVIAELSKAVAALPPPAKGDQGDPGQPGERGESGHVDHAEIARLLIPEVERAVAALPKAESIVGPQGDRGEDGKSVSIEDVLPLIMDEVVKQIDAIPKPKDGEPGRDGAAGADGKDGADGQRGVDGADGKDGIDGAPGRDGTDGIDGKDGRDGNDGAPGERGLPGAPGRLPIVRAWTDTIHYEGAVVSHAGASYQAVRDTGRQPPHEDWICIAAAGRDGNDGRSPTVRDTYSAEVDDYRELNIVALGGAAFIARRDNPGVCPGDGWQLIAMQGKRGNAGERGLKGERGPAGPAVTGLEISADGMLTQKNADGSIVECDMYPVLSKLR